MLTKQDLTAIDKLMSNRFSEQDKHLERLKDQIVKDITYMLQQSVINVLCEHEKRLDRLEKHVGGFPTIAS